MIFPKMNVFRSATLKLTVGYTLIIMAISVFFSFSVYQLSLRQFRAQAEREIGVFRNFGVPEQFLPDDVTSVRENILHEFTSHAVGELVFFNLIILVVAGTGSYFLARRTLRPIEQSVEAQRQFTADASHELRTPLTAMKTEIEVAMRNPAFNSENAKTLLRSNLEEIDALTDLSDSLLRLARYEESNGLAFSPVGVSSVLAEAHGRVSPHTKKKRITIEVRPTSDSVLGDQQALVELFVILLDNAIKYSGAESSVSAWAERAGHSVRIYVRDHGQGIRAVDIPRIFDRFYRADQSRSRQHVHGYGLGLAIAKAIVTRHHGQIDVRSVPDEGTTLSVTLSSADSRFSILSESHRTV